MANLSSVLRAEIIRISRKEIRESVKSVQKTNVGLRKTVTELKRRIAAVEAQNKKLLSFHKEDIEPQVNQEKTENGRVTSKGIRALRSKLGLSQISFAKLLGVSSQAVYAMEHKEGKTNLRSATLEKFLYVNNLERKMLSAFWKRTGVISRKNAQVRLYRQIMRII